MPTLKQTRANRLNAQKCTGPSSAEGKARSSGNALKSGIQAESEVLPWEDPAERAGLREEYTHHNQPCTPQERALVDNLVHAEFVLRRLRRAEVKIVISKIPDGADLDDDAVIGQAYIDASGELGRLQRRMDATNRAFHRDLDEFRLLVAERPPFDPPLPLILVPSQPEPPPSEPAAPESGPPAPSPAPAGEAHPATPPDPPASTAETTNEPAAPHSGPPAPSPAPAGEAPSAAPPDPPAPAAEAANEPAGLAPAAESPDPQSPIHSRFGEPGPQPPPPASPAPAPQPPVVVLVGLNRIVRELSKNRTPTQLATLTLPQAAALRESPAPESVDPDLSTTQPTESTTKTQQMDSFGKKPEIAPEPAPTPAPEKPRGFNPKNPHHPPIEMCAWCTDHGQIQTNCHFWPRGWPRT